MGTPLQLQICQLSEPKERKRKSDKVVHLSVFSNFSSRGSTDSFGGWPPSSNPPDLPSVSPPAGVKDMVLPSPIGAATPLIPGAAPNVCFL